MSSKLNRSLKFVREIARLMVGVPDYDNYVAQRALTHPGEPVMSYEAFFRERQESRYNSRKCTTRCC